MVRMLQDTSNENLTLKKNYIRIIPEVSIDVRSPQYVFNSKNVIFEPILQYYISNKDRGYNNFFINEDSRKSNIDILNFYFKTTCSHQNVLRKWSHSPNKTQK